MQPNKQKKAENNDSVWKLLHRFEKERNSLNTSKFAVKLIKICEDKTLGETLLNYAGRTLISKGFRKEGAEILVDIAKDNQANNDLRMVIALDLPDLGFEDDAISIWITLVSDPNLSNEDQEIFSFVALQQAQMRHWEPKLINIALDSTKEIADRGKALQALSRMGSKGGSDRTLLHLVGSNELDPTLRMLAIKELILCDTDTFISDAANKYLVQYFDVITGELLKIAQDSKIDINIRKGALTELSTLHSVMLNFWLEDIIKNEEIDLRIRNHAASILAKGTYSSFCSKDGYFTSSAFDSLEDAIETLKTLKNLSILDDSIRKEIESIVEGLSDLAKKQKNRNRFPS